MAGQPERELGHLHVRHGHRYRAPDHHRSGRPGGASHLWEPDRVDGQPEREQRHLHVRPVRGTAGYHAAPAPHGSR